MLTQAQLTQLEAMSLRVREHIISMATDGGCFLGASLSCTDLIVYLYAHFLNINLDRLKDPQRDYLLLSKGHDVPALYGTFVELGWLPAERLQNHLKCNDVIYWHPNRAVPGVEFHSGSLGHLLPVAVGIAYDCKLRQQQNRVVVITGDGELNEGSNWEALLVANAYRLDNLIVVVDRNAFQANVETEKLIPLEPLVAKFRTFGCEVRQIDGHDFMTIDRAFHQLPYIPGKSSVLVAKTIRGRGLPSIEARADRWFCNFTQDEVEQLLEELHGMGQVALQSETLMVR